MNNDAQYKDLYMEENGLDGGMVEETDVIRRMSKVHPDS